MINPTIETDLVGELVELYDITWTQREPGGRLADLPNVQTSLVARGRIRAVTGGDKQMHLWLEVVDDISTTDVFTKSAPQVIGDVFRIEMEPYEGERRMRILKDPR